MNVENLIASMATIIIAISAGLVPTIQSLWFLPLVGGIISVVGLNFEKPDMMDGGILLSIFSFLYIQRNIEPLLINLILALLIFFLLFTILVINRRAIVTSRIKKETVGDRWGEFQKDFELKSIISISYTMVSALLVASLGALIALYSPIGLDLTPGQATMIILGLAGAFFLITYLILDIIPKLSEKA